MASKIRRDDEVVVLTGKDKGKRGTGSKVLVAEGRVYVSGVNLVKKASEASPGSEHARRYRRERSLNSRIKCSDFQPKHW